MTGYTTPSGIVSTSSDTPPFYAWTAFNPGSGSFWYASSGAPQWLQYQFGTPHTVQYYTLSNAGIGSQNFIFQGSSDGSAWTTLDSETGVVSGTFIIASPGSFAYYRITISYNSEGNPGLGGVQFYGS
jgi:hypothetical protein